MSDMTEQNEELKKLTIERIQEEAQEDLTFDSILDAESGSLRAPFIKEKYARYLFQVKSALKKSEIDRNKIYRELHTHYTENHPKRLQKTDVPVYIKGDPKYIKVQARYESNLLRVEYLENVLKAIDSLSFNMGNAVKLHIFMNGGA